MGEQDDYADLDRPPGGWWLGDVVWPVVGAIAAFAVIVLFVWLVSGHWPLPWPAR